MAISLKISYSNLDLWRPADTVQNLESLGLSGRIDSLVHAYFLAQTPLRGPFLINSTNVTRLHIPGLQPHDKAAWGGGGQNSRIFSQRIYMTVVMSAANHEYEYLIIGN